MTAKRKGAPARRTAGNFLMGVLVLTAAVLMNGGILASRAEAVTEVPMLEVTGTLERVEPMEDGERLVLNVNGKEASGPLFSDCHFLDERGTLIPKDDFLRRYMKRYVTVELDEDQGVIYVCRLGAANR